TKVSGGYQVRHRKSFNRSTLFIFEVSATDPERTGKPVIIWWFVSGSHAKDIVTYYSKRFPRGARFITYGKWEWDPRRATFTLQVHKPADELEMLPSPNDFHTPVDDDAIDTAHDALTVETDPKLAMIHVGRCVPVYRKLGEFPSKRVREIVHGVLSQLPDDAIEETLSP